MSRGLMIQKMLQEGKVIERHKESGNSMLPIIKSRQPVTLEPITEETELKKDDIVFCKVKGNYYTHKISGVKENQFQISNNKGFVNGWISRDKIFGKVTKIWDN